MGIPLIASEAGVAGRVLSRSGAARAGMAEGTEVRMLRKFQNW